MVQGGAALHLIESIDNCDGIINVAMQHEQASAMAADAYARVNQSVGATIATSGPGATNLLTGIACSYFDSIPTVHVTGNVASFRQSDSLGIRQYGFQETDIVSMAKPITKFAKRIETPVEILSSFPEAVRIALEGRKGPVLIDIPDDFQRFDLDDVHCQKALGDLLTLIKPIKTVVNSNVIEEEIAKTINLLMQAERPVFIFGAGLDNSELQNSYKTLAEKLDIPYFITWPRKGMSDDNDPLNLGTFGTHSARGNNVVLQNADFILSVGSRLDTRATAKLDSFARGAKICMVDIDRYELQKFAKFNFEIYQTINMSAEGFIIKTQELLNSLVRGNDLGQWHSYIATIRAKYNVMPQHEMSLINPYEAALSISKCFAADDVICVDTGTCLPLTLVYGKEKSGQKYISSFNNTPMGYGLPAAVGSAIACNRKVFCIVGDGGFQMNIQELATIANLELNIVIFVYNNFGHAMIKQTQDDWLESNYCMASTEQGLPVIEFANVASAYGISSVSVSENRHLESVLSNLESQTGPYLIELSIHPDFRYEPIIKYGNPLESMSPDSFNKQIQHDMYIPPYKS
ncbi:biosynthetic-type acetolactate synthase large subunit [Aliiglaciecola sp. NS0011-25]